MNKKNFSMDFTVRYHEIDTEWQASPLTLLFYLEDAAIAHSEAVGYDAERMRSESLAWLLRRWHIQVERYPVCGEKVVVETWPSSFERFYGRREFLIRTPEGEALCNATSLWIFYSMARKRPCRISPEFGTLYGLNAMRALEDSFAPLPAFSEDHGQIGAASCGLCAGEDAEKAEVRQNGANTARELTVRYGDIDTNGHVNNAYYLQWMLEAVPPDFYRSHRLASVEIRYDKETTYGSVIRSQCSIEDADELKGAYMHIIRDRDSGQDLAAGRTVWVKK